MRISKIDHTAPQVSEDIRQLMVASYTIEARLIGATHFPPLQRTAEDIRSALARFFGCTEDGDLVAVAEVETAEHGGLHIGGFVVHPRAFRRGIGSRLLSHVLQSSGGARVTVSTAERNRPAISMYEMHGFTIARRWVIQGIDMITLATRDQPGPFRRRVEGCRDT
jgi:GNAT superfamily N-acetyltransferase